MNNTILSILLTIMFFTFEIIASIQDIKTKKVKNYCHYIPIIVFSICLIFSVCFRVLSIKDLVALLLLVGFCVITKNTRGGADTDSMITYIMYVFSVLIGTDTDKTDQSFRLEIGTEDKVLLILITFFISTVLQGIYQFIHRIRTKQKEKLPYMPALTASYLLTLFLCLFRF